MSKTNKLTSFFLMAAIFLLSTFCSQNSFAMMPVIDIGAITQLIEQYKTLQAQLTTLTNAYNTAKSELDQQKELVSDLKGNYGYGNILNGNSDTTNREFSPDNWDGALKGLSGGNPDRYQQLVSEYQKNNPTLSANDFQKGASADRTAVYQQDVETNQAVSVNTSYAYNDINQHIENIQTLSKNIESTKDEKAAEDLSTRMQTEIAYLQVELVRQIVLLNEQVARASASNIQSQTQEAKFDDIDQTP